MAKNDKNKGGKNDRNDATGKRADSSGDQQPKLAQGPVDGRVHESAPAPSSGDVQTAASAPSGVDAPSDGADAPLDALEELIGAPNAGGADAPADGGNETTPDIDAGNADPIDVHALEASTKEILDHFNADTLITNVDKTNARAEHVAPDGVVVFDAVDVKGNVLATGTFLELLGVARGVPSYNESDVKADDKPEAPNCPNLDALTMRLVDLGISLSYERGEAKDGSKHWSLTASIEDDESSRVHTVRIEANATETECEDAFQEIIRAFMKA